VIYLELLESRTLCSVAVAPPSGIHPSPVMTPGSEFAIEVGKNVNAPRQANKLPVVTPTPPPAMQIVTLADPSDIQLIPIGPGYSLWGDTGQPHRWDVVQGNNGTCWAIGPMAALAEFNPTWLESALSVAANGHILIHFDGTSIVYDELPTIGGQQCQGNPDHALWPLYLEKFIAIMQGGQFAYLNGGWMTTFYNDVHLAYQYQSLTSDSQLCTLIDTATANHQAITVGTNSGTDGTMIGSHCYYFLGHEVVDGVTYYHLGQPWGAPQWDVKETLSQLQFNAYPGIVEA
jgi:hypothetical protein